MNLLHHTLEILEENGKTVDDISWIGTEDSLMTWDTFEEWADQDLDNSSFGLMDVPADLKVVGETWWLELDTEPSQVGFQVEWAYKEQPQKPLTAFDDDLPDLHTEEPMTIIAHEDDTFEDNLDRQVEGITEEDFNSPDPEEYDKVGE